MKRLGFFGTAILLQVLVLLTPNYYGWANVGGLFVFAIVYCFSSWLAYCSNRETADTKSRLDTLERETREMNSALQWREK